MNPNSLTMIGIVNLLGENPLQNVPLTVAADLTDTEYETNVVQQFNIVLVQLMNFVLVQEEILSCL